MCAPNSWIRAMRMREPDADRVFYPRLELLGGRYHSAFTQGPETSAQRYPGPDLKPAITPRSKTAHQQPE